VQGELSDATVNFDIYWILQQHLWFLCRSTVFFYRPRLHQRPF